MATVRKREAGMVIRHATAVHPQITSISSILPALAAALPPAEPCCRISGLWAGEGSILWGSGGPEGTRLKVLM
ncbi:hypothetical protein MHYP_G00077440 [Metynnis hypsauchen]